MHGCGSGSALLLNAEVDSMGGVVDGGVGIGIKTSPRRAAIEKAQAELRQEYDVRDERRRELEFLEKGGNPLDFKFGNAASVSVQSTSLIDHHAEHFVTSEAKVSFPLVASPHGDSVESSGRPGAPTFCEPNSADNFDGENELLEGERKPKHASRRNNSAPSEQSSQMDVAQNAKESEDSAIFRPYARRNRSRASRDGARSSSTDVGHESFIPVCGSSRDIKGSMSETKNQKEQITRSVTNAKPASQNGDMVSQIEAPNAHSSVELDGVQAPETISNHPEDKVDVIESNALKDNQHDQLSEVDAEKTAKEIASGECDLIEGKDQVSAFPECLQSAATTTTGNETTSVLPSGSNNFKEDGNQGLNGNEAIAMKGLDSESSTQTSPNVDVNKDNDLFANCQNDDSSGTAIKTVTEFEGTQSLIAGDIENEKDVTKVINSDVVTIDYDVSPHKHLGNDSLIKTEEGIQRSDSQNVAKFSHVEGKDQHECIPSETDRRLGTVYGGDSGANKENLCSGGPQSSVDVSESPQSTLLEKATSGVVDAGPCSTTQQKLADKAYEDSILEEARIIEAKRKRIAELSVGVMPSEIRQKSHWDFVLEEMAWLANDFAQERLWKLTAAAQICHRVAFTSRVRIEEQNQELKLKRVAYTLSEAIMQFWHSAEVLHSKYEHSVGLENLKQNAGHFNGNEFSDYQFGRLDKEACKELGLQNSGKDCANPICGYALSFLSCNKPPIPSFHAEAPSTPDRVADLGIMDISWDDHLTEESLFYAVPAGAMEIYRVSIESHLAQCDKTSNGMQEEVDTSSLYNTAAEFGYHDNVCEEEEAETSMYHSHGVFDGTKSTKHDLKKWKNSTKSYSTRLYEVGADLSYQHGATASQQNQIMGKRPSSNLKVGSIPTKRMRTASRQRIISPFNPGTTGVLPAPIKTDASSGDTSSFQDDQSPLHGGSQMQRSVEVESVGEFEKHLSYDCAETSAKPKKKKKEKHLGFANDLSWQLDSIGNNEQRENSKRRLESYHFDSNGTSGLYGQPTAKKPKMHKQSLENTFDNMAAVTESVPSPVASQMSNMSNTNRFMKLITGKDRGRKSKSLKMSSGQPGSNNPWSPFEDQALVVLVHDMGPNWELISDAMNNTLQFKCIFRKPRDCKERHRILMDKGSGDGADSAEDSGSSQSYPSTLPGIPKGSAWQLFQRLQGPMEEDTLKSHFEKIVTIGKKQHYRRNQNDNQDPRQIMAVHNSHVIALSQVCPNNLNGGILTPLDFRDPTPSSPDVVSLGYQGSYSGSLPMANQGSVASVLSPAATNSSMPGSSGMVLGNSTSSPSGTLNTPSRDGRYSGPRVPLPVDEQQRMQHYTQMLSGRNAQQSNVPVSGSYSGADRGVRMVPAGNGVGMMPGANRTMPLSRPLVSSSMLNSGSMLSSGMVGMPSPLNLHSGAGQGNSMMRPREGVHMMRPGINPEHQRQMLVPELQAQVTPVNNQGISAFNGLSSAFPSQTTTPAQTYAGHPQQQHQISPQQSHILSNSHHSQGPNHTTGSHQQAYAIRYAKERQMQQRLLQQQQQQRQHQQQQQFAASNALMPHVQHQSQLPTSTSMQNNPQIQPQALRQPGSLSPLTPASPMTPISVQQQQQQKHNLSHHGLSRNPQHGASGLTNQTGKQRQRQPQQFQQSGRHHPQQRQHSPSPQQAKLLKGGGRGNMMGHQGPAVDHSHLNGLSMPLGNQGGEKGEQIVNLMQGSGLYSGAGPGSIQQPKSLIPAQSSNNSQLQQKSYSCSTTPLSKPLQQVPLHSDNSIQGQVQPVPSVHAVSVSPQTVPAAVMPSNQQHIQPHQKQVSQAQAAQPTAQRLLQQNRQLNADLPTDKGHTDQSLSNASQMITTTTTATKSCNDLTSAVPVVAPLQKPSEPPLCDSTLPDSVSESGSICSSLANSSGNEPKASVSKGQRQLPGGMPQHGHNAGTQWQQQPQLQQSTTGAASSQKLFQAGEQQHQDQQQSPQQQLPPQQQTQQQKQHLQSTQGSLYTRPTNSNLE